MNLSELLAENYNFIVDDVELFTSHFGTEIYSAKTNKGEYIVKTLPLDYDHDMEKEGHITDYLHDNGIKPVCSLINNFTKWLYENAETLEKELLI